MFFWVLEFGTTKDGRPKPISRDGMPRFSTQSKAEQYRDENFANAEIFETESGQKAEARQEIKGQLERKYRRQVGDRGQSLGMAMTNFSKE